jgi:hypothetical protein
MSVPGWNPDWYHAGESILSVALKLAYGNSTTVREALRGLTGATQDHRVVAMFPTSDTLGRVCRLLDLPLDAGKHLAAGIGPPTEVDRRFLCQALRWCPSCMAQRYHSWKFQDWRRTHCIWHSDALLERCPRCGLVVDPFEMVGWQCPYCREPFAEPLGQGWIERLRRPVDADRYANDALDLRLGRTVTSSGNQISVRLHQQHDSGEFGLNGLGWSESAWLRWHAWEECSALADCQLHDHGECVTREWLAGRTEFAITSYTCPLGAAVRQTVAWTGCQHERAGGWPVGGMHAADDYGAFCEPLISAPRWLVPALARELIREWLADAIRTFSAASQEAPSHCSWRPPSKPTLKWRADGLEGQIFVAEPAEALAAIIAEGNRACVTART